MGLTKQFVQDVLRGAPGADGSPLLGGDRLVWAAACDAVASIKVQHAGDTPDARRAVALRAFEALSSAARSAGERVDSLLVEFVNHAGEVVQAERLGSGAPGAAQTPRPAGPAAAPAPAPGGGHPGGRGAPGGHTPIPGLNPGASGLDGLGHVIAVGAGKGGVGKSTISLNLAVGLARRGYRVGLLDADIYGPSMPTMLALAGQQPIVREGVLEPFYAHGVRCMTMGALVQADKPLIWRGPMAHGAFKQLLEQTHWGELDYLVIDLPPGTGDVSLTMAQMLRLTGAVVVCTPQKVAQDDAVRAARMFEQLGVPVLGVVENMSYFVGDDGKEYDIFGRGGAEGMARRLGVPFLGGVAITTALRVHSDSGNPTANFTGTDRAGTLLRDDLERLVRAVEGQVALATLRQGQTRPTLSVS
jgi:ATP-binding protein involved in chromosome partitioning